MREITLKLHTFDELSGDAKEKARDWYREHALDYDWWGTTYEDASNVGLIIKSFDLYRHEIEGGFQADAVSCALAIKKGHGEKTETWATANAFLKQREKFSFESAKNGHADTDEDAFNEELNEMGMEFLHDILEDYRIMLQMEMEYLMSNESIDESIRANEYEFTAEGKRCTKGGR